MTLSAHAVVGASVASIMPSHPVLGFVAGFGSHFLSDAIPHWDCFHLLKSVKKDDKNPINTELIFNKNFLGDLFKIGSDGILGLLLVYLIFIFPGTFSTIAVLAGAIGGMIPDFFIFVQMKLKCEPFTSLRKFHMWIHSKIQFDNRPVLGISLQVIIVAFLVPVCGSLWQIGEPPHLIAISLFHF